MSEAGKEVRHIQRMVRKKAVVDQGIAAAQDERGVLLINTGNGKGKSSAAFGVVARALGHGRRAGAAVTDVVHDAALEQRDVLRHHGDRLAQT